jgi:hypothetical protein
MSPQKLLFCYHLPTRGRAWVKLGDAWYVANVSIVFDAPCLFLHQLLCVLFTLRGIFMHFLELTYWQDATVPVHVFCSFCVSEKLHKKYSWNWTKQKPKFLFTWKEDGVQRRDGAGPGGGRTIGWRRPPPGRATRWSGPLVHLLTSPFRLYIHFIGKTLLARTLFHETYCKPPASSTQEREGPEALPDTLPERGIFTEGLLHHHACLRSDAWVVYLGLWVHSSS